MTVVNNRKMSAAHAIVECLKRADVKKVFCVPGESYLPVLDALYDEESIEVISTRHEGGAAFMAEGYGEASNTAGIVFATRGVGADRYLVHTAEHFEQVLRGALKREKVAVIEILADKEQISVSSTISRIRKQ